MTSDDFEAYQAKRAAGEALETDVFPENKLNLFRALAAAGIEVVKVHFDGCGDSGQIDSIDTFNGDNAEIDLPREPIVIKDVDFAGPKIVVREPGAREAIETMVYDLLSRNHGGWEDNYGAFGEFTFTTSDHSILLEFNERFIDTEYHEHRF